MQTMLLRSPSKHQDLLMKENEKETETEGNLHLDPPPVMDVDGKDVSDEDNDSTFGSEYDMAAEFNFIELDSDDEPANTTGTNIPHFPSLPPARPTQARGSTATVNPRPLAPPSSTTAIPPTRTRGLAGSKLPRALAPASIFPMSSTQTRSSTGTNISRPLGPPTFATIAAPPQAKGSAPSSSRLSSAARGVSIWQTSLLSSEPSGPPPGYTPSAQSLCVVRNSRITKFVYISSLSVHADLQRETGL